ncbi:hypothetical protein C8R43DRAFT_940722 [Mycena crocata]|nr:hypothetical protein C8R43DRAFT_940722 [Mycena crocata]
MRSLPLVYLYLKSAAILLSSLASIWPSVSLVRAGISSFASNDSDIPSDFIRQPLLALMHSEYLSHSPSPSSHASSLLRAVIIDPIPSALSAIKVPVNPPAGTPRGPSRCTPTPPPPPYLAPTYKLCGLDDSPIGSSDADSTTPAYERLDPLDKQLNMYYKNFSPSERKTFFEMHYNTDVANHGAADKEIPITLMKDMESWLSTVDMELMTEWFMRIRAGVVKFATGAGDARSISNLRLLDHALSTAQHSALYKQLAVHNYTLQLIFKDTPRCAWRHSTDQTLTCCNRPRTTFSTLRVPQAHIVKSLLTPAFACTAQCGPRQRYFNKMSEVFFLVSDSGRTNMYIVLKKCAHGVVEMRARAAFCPAQISRKGLNEGVAIEIIRPDSDGQLDERRLKREAEVWALLDHRVWALLNHRNLVPFLGISDEVGPWPGLVSPYYELGHVGKFVREHPEADRPRMAVDVASGLEYLLTPTWDCSRRLGSRDSGFVTRR